MTLLYRAHLAFRKARAYPRGNPGAIVMPHPLAMFDRVAIINLPERTDRRREMTREIERIGGFDDGRITFVEAVRPPDAGDFPSIGARGCFMSHLAALRAARDAGVKALLLIEDDCDFARDFTTRGAARLARLAAEPWDIFHGSWELPAGQSLRGGEAPLASNQPISTTAFIAINRSIIGRLVESLEAMLGRPAGSADYGPMHVDGAYSVFRLLNPNVIAFAADPPLAHQRSSRSDISETAPLIDRISMLRPAANLARRWRHMIRGR